MPTSLDDLMSKQQRIEDDRISLIYEDHKHLIAQIDAAMAAASQRNDRRLLDPFKFLLPRDCTASAHDVAKAFAADYRAAHWEVEGERSGRQLTFRPIATRRGGPIRFEYNPTRSISSESPPKPEPLVIPHWDRTLGDFPPGTLIG